MVKKLLKKLLMYEDIVYCWLKINIKKIVRFIVLSIVAVFLTRLPYLNLFISKWIVFYFLTVLILLIFKVSIKKVVLLCIVLVLFALVFQWTGEYKIAEAVGNYLFGLFFVVLIKSFLEKKYE